jgi:hypothetical protein
VSIANPRISAEVDAAERVDSARAHLKVQVNLPRSPVQGLVQLDFHGCISIAAVMILDSLYGASYRYRIVGGSRRQQKPRSHRRLFD